MYPPNIGKWDHVKVQFDKRNFSGCSLGKLLFTWVDLIQELILEDTDARGPVGLYSLQEVFQNDLLLKEIFDKH